MRHNIGHSSTYVPLSKLVLFMSFVAHGFELCKFRLFVTSFVQGSTVEKNKTSIRNLTRPNQ